MKRAQTMTQSTIVRTGVWRLAGRLSGDPQNCPTMQTHLAPAPILLAANAAPGDCLPAHATPAGSALASKPVRSVQAIQTRRQCRQSANATPDFPALTMECARNVPPAHTPTCQEPASVRSVKSTRTRRQRAPPVCHARLIRPRLRGAFRRSTVRATQARSGPAWACARNVPPASTRRPQRACSASVAGLRGSRLRAATPCRIAHVKQACTRARETTCAAPRANFSSPRETDASTVRCTHTVYPRTRRGPGAHNAPRTCTHAPPVRTLWTCVRAMQATARPRPMPRAPRVSLGSPTQAIRTTRVLYVQSIRSQRARWPRFARRAPKALSRVTKAANSACQTCRPLYLHRGVAQGQSQCQCTNSRVLWVLTCATPRCNAHTRTHAHHTHMRTNTHAHTRA